jgi:hypothetical protein
MVTRHQSARGKLRINVMVNNARPTTSNHIGTHSSAMYRKSILLRYECMGMVPSSSRFMDPVVYKAHDP